MKRLACVIALAACSAQQTPREQAPPPPLTQSASAPAKVTTAVSSSVDSVSLETFQPLLSLPELRAVRRALDAEDPRRAATAIKQRLAKVPSGSLESLRLQFLLGRVLQGAGEVAAAAEAYRAASNSPWPLRDHAWFFLAKIALGRGDYQVALEHFSKVTRGQPIFEEARAARADALAGLGKWDEAIESWQEREKSGGLDNSTALKLARALLERSKRGASVADATEAVRLARRVAADTAGQSDSRQAEALSKLALERLPAAERARFSRPTAEEQLIRVGALSRAREHEAAERTANELLTALSPKDRYQHAGCEALILRGKAISAQRETGRAADSLKDALARCKEPDQRARALYLAGRFAARDGRHAQAVQHFAQLEKELPKHRLADDARMLRALAYFDMGVEARFTELLAAMPQDYPDGDMMLDGVFRLAMRRVEKGDWSGAASILDRAAEMVSARDSARGTEFSGRERYFRARAWIETGEKDRGYAELEAMVRELPLSYYMLHAYTRLVERDPFGAKRLRDEAAQKSAAEPFTFPQRPELASVGFQRAMELLRQSEFELAREEIEALGLVKPGAAPELLWAIALLYARSGSAQDAHQVTRGLLTDWLSRWPAGDWVKAWELAFPRPYRDMVVRASTKNQVPEALVYAIMREESAFDPRAESPADAHGLMQLIVPTARLLAKPVGLPYDPASLKRPRVNIALGTRGLAELGQTFRQNPVLAIPGYNAGPGRPRRWLRERPSMDFDVWVESIPYNETRRYTKRVLASRAAYAYLYAPDLADEMMVLPLRLTP
ncbi:MAG: transglycosylase SLT domain-containing protein [Polyangiaceae bacterium]